MQVSEAYTVELWIDDIKNIRKVDNLHCNAKG